MIEGHASGINLHNSKSRRIDNLLDIYAGRHEELYDYIYYKASLGIIPQEALKLNDKEYKVEANFIKNSKDYVYIKENELISIFFHKLLLNYYNFVIIRSCSSFF